MKMILNKRKVDKSYTLPDKVMKALQCKDFRGSEPADEPAVRGRRPLEGRASGPTHVLPQGITL